MRIDQSSRDGCAILAPVGEFNLEAMPALRRVLLKRLAEQPVAVICDLSGLWAMDSSCAAVFTSVANHPSSHWPETSLLVCCAQPAVSAMLERLGMPQFLAMHPTVQDALSQARSRPPYLRAELPLWPSLTAPEVARRFVLATCWQWRLQAADDPADPLARLWGEELVDRAVLVASELVTNAVVHTRGPLRLRLELVAGRLHLAVADQSPRLLGWRPTLATPRPRAVGACWWSTSWPAPGGCSIRPRAARSSGVCWNAELLLAGAGAPSAGGAAARRAERPTRVTGTIRPDPGSRWSPRSRQSAA